jgi:hypothetical protein
LPSLVNLGMWRNVNTAACYLPPPRESHDSNVSSRATSEGIWRDLGRHGATKHFLVRQGIYRESPGRPEWDRIYHANPARSESKYPLGGALVSRVHTWGSAQQERIRIYSRNSRQNSMRLNRTKADDFQWVPQATLNLPIDFFRSKWGIKFHQETDELDRFEGSGLMNAKGTAFVLRYYPGYPEGTVTVYLPFELTPLEVLRSIEAVLNQLEVPTSSIRWRREY